MERVVLLAFIFDGLVASMFFFGSVSCIIIPNLRVYLIFQSGGNHHTISGWSTLQANDKVVPFFLIFGKLYSWGTVNLGSRLFSSFHKLNAGFFNIHVF